MLPRFRRIAKARCSDERFSIEPVPVEAMAYNDLPSLLQFCDDAADLIGRHPRKQTRILLVHVLGPGHTFINIPAFRMVLFYEEYYMAQKYRCICTIFTGMIYTERIGTH